MKKKRLITLHDPRLPLSVYIVFTASIVANAVVTYVILKYFVQ